MERWEKEDVEGKAEAFSCNEQMEETQYSEQCNTLLTSSPNTITPTLCDTKSPAYYIQHTLS